MFELNKEIKPRKYQLDASEKAKENESCVISIPTGMGKTLVGLMYAIYLLNENKARKILVLEPTRILVDQMYQYYVKNSNIPTEKIYGILEKKERISRWKNAIIACHTTNCI